MDLLTNEVGTSLDIIDDIVARALPIIPDPLPADDAAAITVLQGVLNMVHPQMESLRRELDNARRTQNEAIQTINRIRDAAAAQAA